jgi:hypothetical protein
MEYIEYIEECFYNAFWKSWGYVGMGLAFLVFVVMLAFRVQGGIEYRDIFEGLLASLIVFIVVLFYNFHWELKKSVFADIRIEKKNNVADARIVVCNKEFSDFTDLIVQILKHRRVFQDGRTEDWIVNEESGDVLIEGSRVVTYGDGTKEVIVASGENGSPFLGSILEVADREVVDGYEQLIYDVIIVVKGKIDGRVVLPKKIHGRLKYSNSSKPTYAVIQGKKYETSTSKFQWVSLPSK